MISIEEVKNMSLGRNLTMLLYDKKMEQRELAKAAEVSEAMISRVIAGERDIGSEKLKKIADYLEVSVDELLR